MKSKIQSDTYGTCEKMLISSCCLACLLAVVNKSPFERSEVGLFTSNNANKADVYAMLSAGAWTKEREASTYELTDGSEDEDTVAFTPTLAALEFCVVQVSLHQSAVSVASPWNFQPLASHLL